MSRLAFITLCTLFALLACGGPSSHVDAPDVFNPAGLKLVIGVERTKTIEVSPDGTVTTGSGEAPMKFVGQELKLADGSKTLLALQGTTLRGPTSDLGTFEGDTLLIGPLGFSIDDDGVVHLERDGSKKKMRLHFEGSVVGHKRPAMMLVALVFVLYVATNPTANLDRYVD